MVASPLLRVVYCCVIYVLIAIVFARRWRTPIAGCTCQDKLRFYMVSLNTKVVGSLTSNVGGGAVKFIVTTARG